MNFAFPNQAADANAAVEQNVERAHACRMGPFCLHRATENRRRENGKAGPLAAMPGMTIWFWWSFKMQLEVEDHARGNAQIVLTLSCGSKLVETRQEIIYLSGANGEATRYFHVHAATDGHRERIA